MRDIGNKFLALLLKPFLFGYFLDNNQNTSLAVGFKSRFLESDAQDPFGQDDLNDNVITTQQAGGLKAVVLAVTIEKFIQPVGNTVRLEHRSSGRIGIDQLAIIRIGDDTNI